MVSSNVLLGSAEIINHIGPDLMKCFDFGGTSMYDKILNKGPHSLFHKR